MSTRGHWKPAEDEKLKELVEKYGPHNWNAIAEKLQGRSGKSCRLRWFNQLDPNINRAPFTEEEEELLVASQRMHGNRWALIARFFPGRTDNAVKNQWHVIMARRCKEKHVPHRVDDSRSYSYHEESCRPMNDVVVSSSFCMDAYQERQCPVEFYDFLRVQEDSMSGSGMEQDGIAYENMHGHQFIDFLSLNNSLNDERS